MLFLIFIFIYFITVLILDFYYTKRYIWLPNCLLERLLTGLLQPLMEVCGNRMTAHFWHFRQVLISKEDLPSEYLLRVEDYKKSRRVFGKNKLMSILSSIWVDINPHQNCLIIQPVNYFGQWQLVFPSNWDDGIFEEEKCFHVGCAKIVVDGTGFVLARDRNGNFLQLKIVSKCKAYQYRHILFI